MNLASDEIARMESAHRMYRHCISLGYNCEVAHNFWRLEKCVESSLFTWAWATLEQLLCALSVLDKMCAQGVTLKGVHNGVYADNFSRVLFHSRLNTTVGVPAQELKEAEEELVARVQHLGRKFLRVASEERDVVYFYKNMDRTGNPLEEMEENIKLLYRRLEELHTYPFTLVVICEEKSALAHMVAPPDMDLHIRTVRFFTPDNQVIQGEWDREGWERIFNEFPPRKMPIPPWFKREQTLK